MIPQATAQRVLRVFAAATTLLAAGCRPQQRHHSTLDLSRYEQLSASQTEPLQLVKVDSVMLGTAADGVNSITDFQIQNDQIYVLDGMSKSVRVFARDGRLLRTIGRSGNGPGEFSDPMALGLHGGQLFVADPKVGKRLSVFGPAGKFVAQRAIDVPTVPVALAISEDRIATMGILTVADQNRQGAYAVAVSTLDGEAVGNGCEIDPRYIDSRRRDGLIAHYDMGAVSSRAGLFYCTQGITPVVQVMDLSGKELREIRIAPPFYVAPVDRRMTMNQKEIFDFIGSFTTHAAFFPVDDGFVSVYSRFNRDAGEIRYDLLACHGAQTYRCGVVRNVNRPVYVASPDTVYLEEEPQTDRAAQVGIYLLKSSDTAS